MKLSVKKVVFAFICSFGITACATAAQELPQVQDILEYWFGPLQGGLLYPSDKAKLWFGGGEAVDNEIRNRFGNLVAAAANNELVSWKETPRGRLALIILVDQFTRNIYRGTPQAFAYDSVSQNLVLEGLTQEHDEALLPIERVFFYLPLEHSESLEMQKKSVEKFHSLLSVVPCEQEQHFISFDNYAWRHYEVIARFGRFPHRNAILQRASTPEEMEFLKGPNSSF